MSTARERISQLLEESSRFNSNDVLVHVDQKQVLPFDASVSSFDLNDFKKILRVANETKKESGVLPLCITKGILTWELKGSAVDTPLLLFPAEIEIDKIQATVSFRTEEELAVVNPFLINRLKTEFGISISSDTVDLDQLIAELEKAGLNTIERDRHFIGNFHHHRFEVIRELEELLISPLANGVAVLLGDETQAEHHVLNLSEELLFPSDPNQQLVYSLFRSENVVVQGPPGTGKSQVLANLLAKLIHADHSTLVVSEKRVALEVLKKKLNEHGLGDLCFISTSETISKDVLSELKVAWKSYENRTAKVPTNLRLSEQYCDRLQLQLDLLNDPFLFGGVGYLKFKELVADRDLNVIEYRSELPETSPWLEHVKLIELLFEKDLHHLVGRTQSGILRSDSFSRMDQHLSAWLKELAELKKLFEINTWGDLQKAMKKAALCQLFSSTEFHRFETLLTPGSKEQKKFEKLYRKYLKEKSLLSTLEAEENNWINPPSGSETDTLMAMLKDRSYIGKWRFNKHWKKVARISSSRAEQVLHQWRQYLHQKNIISQIEVEFCDLGLTSLPSDAEMIHLQLSAYRSEDYEAWRLIKPVERAHYAGANAMLGKLHNDLRLHLRMEESVHLEPFLLNFESSFEQLISLQKELNTLPDQIIRNLANFDSFEALELAVLKHNLVQTSSRFHQLSNFDPSSLLDLVHAVIEEQEKESGTLATLIRSSIAKRFAYYHELLRTPSAKLSSSEKELKSKLKKGKAILVKEFAKSRSFPSIRELFSSEAAIWIRLLKPVWLSNPNQITRCFPMEQDVFDVAIFDEASQIPLQNALGAIQRSKRVLVAGDSQQMGPSSYFKSGGNEAVDVLHQASFHWKNVELKHHYRSEHPGLIAFSNRHFYRNELVTYPSVQQEAEAITWHFCEKGTYDNRHNVQEAKAIAKYVEEILDSPRVPGIVAFSETQLEEIYRHLSPKSKQKLEDRIDHETLFFKALENVQGEECDHLIISLGYGKNPEGEFHMRFGPINSKNGSKRLNVLLTRARKKIDFFSSVTGEDFQISSNEAVDLLRQYLLEIETGSAAANTGFPFDLFPQVSGNLLTFHDLHDKLKDAEELITLVRVLENRGWKIELR